MLFTPIKLNTTAGFLISFSLRKSRYHSLVSWLLGVYLVYVTPDRQKEKENRKSDFIRGKTFPHRCFINVSVLESQGLSHLALTSVNTAARILTFSLEVGSFFLQFLDWWYTQGGSDTGPGDRQDIPKPPTVITG